MIRKISAIISKLHFLSGRRNSATLFFTGLILSGIFSSAAVLGDDENITPAAVVWYKELAAQGDVDAKFNLGMMNETGWSIPVDLKNAVHWYREAAKDGHSEAQLRLGLLYYLGLGTTQSQLKGESWIRKSANQGHKFAESINIQLLGIDTDSAINKTEILRKARKVYLENEKNAVPELKRLISLAKKESKNQEKEKEKTTIRERREERKEQQVAADSKEMSGVTKTPVMKKKVERIESVIPEFVDKESVEENRTLAKGNTDTIQLQAKKGQASAQYNLGRMYELGIKLPVDKKEALNWYEKAAKQGYPDAEYRLAIALLYGVNIEKDETQGRQWLASAAKHGHQVASNLMEKISGNERVLIAGQSIVVDWYLERAIVGDAESALRLGKIYEHGWGAIADAREAGKWYQKAIRLGSKDADKLMKDLSVRLAQEGEILTENDPGIFAHPALPSNWMAYLLALFIAAFIFFSPVLLKKQKQKSDLPLIENNISHREEPPFS